LLTLPLLLLILLRLGLALLLLILLRLGLTLLALILLRLGLALLVLILLILLRLGPTWLLLILLILLRLGLALLLLPLAGVHSRVVWPTGCCILSFTRSRHRLIAFEILVSGLILTQRRFFATLFAAIA
jgi:hypothetical protein